jgi:hypothetical protein
LIDAPAALSIAGLQPSTYQGITIPLAAGTRDPAPHYPAMPRYHFDLIGKRTVRDLAGRDLSDDMLASDVADGLANELYSVRPDLRRQHCSILVTDEDGDEIHRAPIWNPVRD